MKRGSFFRFSLCTIGAIAFSGAMHSVQAQTAVPEKAVPIESLWLSQIPSVETSPNKAPTSIPKYTPLTPTFTPSSNSATGSFKATQGNTPTVPNSVPNTAPPVTFLSDDDYRLGAGDAVQVKFFNVPEYDAEYQISPDGKVNLPLVGRVSLKGLNVEEAGDRLAKVYAKELRHPQITVLLVRRRPLQIVMNGEVIQPGLYTFSSDTGGEPPRLFQSIQAAGGITQSGDLERIQIMRTSVEKNRTQTISANLLTLLQSGDLSQNIDLRDGDIISIPPVSTINVDNLQSLAISNLKSQSTVAVDVSLVGEVSIPGPYRFAPNEQATLISAIQKAGGLSPFADVKQISLERRARDGSKRAIGIDLFAILDTGDRNQDVILQPGDVIKIPAGELSNDQISAIASSTLSSGPIAIAILGEVKSPGAQQVKANTSLNQAILAAGGFSDIARNNIKLLRFNQDGSVTEREIKVDLTQTINAENNPILRSNDIIMVGKSTWGSIKQTLTNFSSNLNFLLPFLYLRKL